MRADRLIAILLRLQARQRVPAQELAQELEVSTRTIYRDIDALSMAGIPVYTERGENGGCFLDEDYRVTLTHLILPEIQALFVMGGAAPLHDLQMDHTVESGLLKLLAALPTRQQSQARAIQQRLYIDTRGWNQSSEAVPFLNDLQTAIWQDREIQATYQSYGNPKPRTQRIAPYGLVVKSHIWYIVGLPATEDELRIYRISRFQQIELTETTFERDPTFDLRGVWHQKRQAFEDLIATNYVVIMRLPNYLLEALDYHIPNRYHVIETHDSQHIIEAHFYNIHEARTIMLGFGKLVDIIEPSELNESVLEFAKSIVGKSKKPYEGPYGNTD